TKKRGLCRHQNIETWSHFALLAKEKRRIKPAIFINLNCWFYCQNCHHFFSVFDCFSIDSVSSERVGDLFSEDSAG
ncbi:hypothetical protein DVW27_15790, partial [Enterococcus faecium]